MSLDFLQLVGQINAKNKTPLTSQQILSARAIFNESVVAGIDPRVALSLSWQESTLGKPTQLKGDLNRGEDHALGSMQVLRSTARGLGMEQDWIRNKAILNKTGLTDPAIDAKMGVALLKELSTKNKATTFGDLAAGYNGGAKLIGKNYGNAQDYVQKTSGHMGRFFGDGNRVSWKQPVLLAAGAAPALAASGPMTAMPNTGAAPTQRAAPTAPAQQMQDYQSMFGLSAGTVPAPAPDAGDRFGGMFSSAPAPQQEDSAMPFGMSAFLPKIESEGEDPIDALKALLGEEYDKQYQSEDA